METGEKSHPSSVIEALTRAFDRRRLGHGLFIVDRGDPSFHEKILLLIRNLLCVERFAKGLKRACEKCDSCLLTAPLVSAPLDAESHSSHPDFFWLKPEGSKGYTADQIRSLQSSFHLKQSLSESRVAWIEDAHLLSASQGSAANALLKLLEEPRPFSFLILTTSLPESVLATLRSRCQQFVFWDPGMEDLEERQGIESKETLKEWLPFQKWLLSGAPAFKLNSVLPADTDTYWKDRNEACQNLENLMPLVWKSVSKKFGALSREESLRVLDVMDELQKTLRRLKGFGQPALQWLAFRDQGKLGFAKQEAKWTR